MARLQDAVAAFREALQELTRARVPLQWAATQNNLGQKINLTHSSACTKSPASYPPRT
jgi:hypothetical protein